MFLAKHIADSISQKMRDAVRCGKFKHLQLVVIENMMREIAAANGQFQVSLDWIAKLANVCKQTVVDAIKAAMSLGILRKENEKVMVKQPDGGEIWQQKMNKYEFVRESTAQPQYPKKVRKIYHIVPSTRAQRAAQTVLDEIAERRSVKLGLKPLPTRRPPLII